ncbi:hypothetical protein [Roseivirga thermotolerans]|uniref:hypothetical protein n=1 Tax=Roseivirga thermotolerans TaxID=1758176 RepID=UPI00273F1E6C|nr:hypothetical protein [Roseivirga thermotolerans]
MGSFENDLKDMFDGVEFQPSEQVWAGVEKALQQKKKRGIFFMWQTYGVAAAIALFAIAGFIYNQGESPVVNAETPKELSQKEDISAKNEPQKNDLNSGAGTGLAADLKTSLPKAQDTENSDSRAEVAARNRERLVADYSNLTEVESVPKEEQFFLPEVLMATPKAYRASLATTRALWMKDLGVSTRPLSELIAGVEIEPENYARQQILSGHVGNNSLNIESESSHLAAFNIEDANVASLRSDVINSSERAIGAISAGFGLSYDLSEKLALGALVRYSQFKVSSTSNAYSVENGKSLPIYLPLGYDPDNVNFTGNYNLTNTLQGISVLPTLSYKVVQWNGFDVSLLAGVGVDYFFDYKVKGDLNFLSVRKADLSRADFISEWNLSGMAGLGLNYRINEQFGVGADVHYRYFVPVSPQDRQASVFGFGLGINYYLNRKP